MINLLLKINIFDENDYKEAIESSLFKSQKKILLYLNSHVLYEANKNIELEKCILSSDYLISDGYSIVWAYKRLFTKNIKKIVFTYSYFNFIRELFINNNIAIYFLGASKKVIEKAVQTEKLSFPNLKIVGYNDGYFKKEVESSNIVSQINNSNADVLIVGMGCPISEKWIIENKDRLNTKLIFSVGGFFDFLSKDKIGAPKWMYNSGFEWIFRLVQEPRRLFKRYLFANSYIIYKLLYEKSNRFKPFSKKNKSPNWIKYRHKYK